MLETKPQSVGRASSRSSARLSSPSPLNATTAARPLPSRRPLSERDSREAERAARRATSVSQTRNHRMTRSEARLLTWTVSSAIIVCGLLVVYLAAYAHLTLLGIEQAKAQHDFREKWQTNQMLRAQIASLKNPDRIAARADRLGLTRDSKRVDYIAPPPVSASSAPPSPPPSVLALGEAAPRDAFSDSAASDSDDSNATMMTSRVGGEAGSQRTDSGPTTDDNSAAHHD